MSHELPRQSDSLFNCGEHYRENFQLNFHTREYDYIRSFKEAGDGVIQAAVGDGGDPSWRFHSACFLYRHYLELALKRIIRRDCWMRGVDFNPADWQNHKLPTLWNASKDAVGNALEEQYHPHIKIVERIVNEFHLIDPTGQELRYDKKITGRGKEPRVITPSLEGVRDKHVGIVNMYEVMGRLDEFFGWVDHCMSEWGEANRAGF